jgi:hypothetical protein
MMTHLPHAPSDLLEDLLVVVVVDDKGVHGTTERGFDGRRPLVVLDRQAKAQRADGLLLPPTLPALVPVRTKGCQCNKWSAA